MCSTTVVRLTSGSTGEKIYLHQGGYEAGAYLSEKSPYRSFFHFNNENANALPDNGSYDGWWHAHVPEAQL